MSRQAVFRAIGRAFVTNASLCVGLYGLQPLVPHLSWLLLAGLLLQLWLALAVVGALLEMLVEGEPKS